MQKACLAAMAAFVLLGAQNASAFTVDDKTANNEGTTANYADPDEQFGQTGLHYNISGPSQNTSTEQGGFYIAPSTQNSNSSAPSVMFQPCSGLQPCPHRW